MKKKTIVILGIFTCILSGAIFYFLLFSRQKQSSNSKQQNNIVTTDLLSPSNELQVSKVKRKGVEEVTEEAVTKAVKNLTKESTKNVTASKETLDNKWGEALEDLVLQGLSYPRELKALIDVDILSMPNPPENIQLTFVPDKEHEYISRRYVSICDENGEIIMDPGEKRLVVNIGSKKAHVTVVDEKKELTTLRYEEKTPFLLTWGPMGPPELVENKVDSRYSEFTYTTDGTPVRAVINGQLFDSEKEPCPVPFLTFPSDKIEPGTKWRCEAPGSKKNYIDAEAKRFVEVAGISCLEIECKTYLTDGIFTAESLEKYYIDIKSGMQVRVDSVNKYVVPDKKEGTKEHYMRSISQLETPDLRF